MLVAIGNDGFQRFASATRRDDPAYCPVCKEQVVLKAGRIVVNHFAHHPDSHCTWGKGESVAHMMMKERIHRWLAEWGVTAELEVPLVDDERRADVLVTTPKGNQFVIECQASPISIDEWDARNSDYAILDMPVLWVWASTRINDRAGRDDEVRLPAEMRHVIDIHPYGVIHVFDTIDPCVYQLYTSEAPEREPSDRDDDRPFKVGRYTPKSLRVIKSKWAVLPNPVDISHSSREPWRLIFQPEPMSDGLTTIDIEWEPMENVTPEATALIDAFWNLEARRAA